ncbi:MAG: hypothetical protein JXB34_15075 [Bacteroidales bacterium]|nr:hypothetical protein [Bacteroidales bacterium]
MLRNKGYRFEEEIGQLLFSLKEKFPLEVEVIKQPIETGYSRQFRADFELIYTLGGLEHHHLIECQDRDKISQNIADKIISQRNETNRNRFIFVYNNSSVLSKALLKRFNKIGVLAYSFNEFTDFLKQLEADLALKQIGKLIVDNPELKGLFSTSFKENPKLLESSSNYNKDYSPGQDHAMLSENPRNRNVNLGNLFKI